MCNCFQHEHGKGPKDCHCCGVSSVTVEDRPQTQEDVINNQVAYFTSMMRSKLYDNMHKGGWRGDATGPLLRRVHEELGEFVEAVLEGRDATEEAADVANFLMMLVDPGRKPA